MIKENRIFFQKMALDKQPGSEKNGIKKVRVYDSKVRAKMHQTGLLTITR